MRSVQKCAPAGSTVSGRLPRMDHTATAPAVRPPLLLFASRSTALQLCAAESESYVKPHLQLQQPSLFVGPSARARRGCSSVLLRLCHTANSCRHKCSIGNTAEQRYVVLSSCLMLRSGCSSGWRCQVHGFPPAGGRARCNPSRRPQPCCGAFLHLSMQPGLLGVGQQPEKLFLQCTDLHYYSRIDACLQESAGGNGETRGAKPRKRVRRGGRGKAAVSAKMDRPPGL